jgi:acetyltransferase
MAVTFTQYAKAKAVGFASVIAVGNSADVKLSELVDLLQRDEKTGSILIYCEGFADGDGRRLVDVVRTAERRVPIVMLKPGVSEIGRIAAKTHTGSLAGEDRIVSAALAEAGIIRATETEEAFDVAIALSSCALPKGRKIVVLSDGGGHATVVSDCAGRYGLELAPLSEGTKEELRRILPDRSAIENPIDFAGFAESDPDSTGQALEICMRDDFVDGAIFAGHFGGYHLMTDHLETQERIATLQTAAAEEMVLSIKNTGKPLIVHTDHGERELATLAPLRNAGVPIYSTLESSAKAMAALAAWYRTEQELEGTEDRRPLTPDIVRTAVRPRRAVPEPEARRRLADFGINVPPYSLVDSPTEATDAFRKFGCTVAMKLISDKLIHKSDMGGVVLNLAAEDQVDAAFHRLSDLSHRLKDRSPSVLMTAMIERGVECIIGAKRDSQFGPVVLFGAGGIFVELINDVSILLAPTSQARARSTIEASVVGRLLKGFRGSRPGDIDDIARLLSQVSHFISSNSDVLEVDLNPVIVAEHGALIADARLVIVV